MLIESESGRTSRRSTSFLGFDELLNKLEMVGNKLASVRPVLSSGQPETPVSKASLFSDSKMFSLNSPQFERELLLGTDFVKLHQRIGFKICSLKIRSVIIVS
eukprot:Gregarina_sp_Poly_1__4371@NODE_2364_length_2229_cov_78_549491_g1506_i0_p4_GENE_NODE_2364_length_2229_cov_78_549491_g1506_i0NODE_2364_length_2229_cov_78_549491_g1506_i0_p4_ORF_typecomplete_len103_score11_49DUF4928/PF16280_5/0_22_NODE_2364_length_2229_cov_78_549491_g1506_i0529837